MPFKYAAILIFTITALICGIGYYLDYRDKHPKKKKS